MGNTSKNICMGILAHVDAGKTTLSEAMLYMAGAIRKLGRVDHKNAFLDMDEQERARGITIFSKQAEMIVEDVRIMLLDTPGHMDFSAEMERTLQVIDYAVLVINGKDGVQGHTVTLWRLLERYDIPVFIFVNKMDLEGTDRRKLMENLKKHLSRECIDFSDGVNDEEVAVCDEGLLEKYLQEEKLSENDIALVIGRRSLFPVYFGSALKVSGVEGFLDALHRYTLMEEYGEDFSARVYKITRDEQGNRLTHMKITGGRLKIKETLNDEKINQIRIYSGKKFRTENEAKAGIVCVVTGPEKTYAGQGIGREHSEEKPVLEPALVYSLVLPEGYDANKVFSILKQLEEEDPQLHIVWDRQLKEIKIQLMGEIQMEIIKNIIMKRFGIPIEFGQGEIAYRETLKEAVVGAGHFEPLRHYAEVQLLMEPAAAGSGLSFDTRCSEDVLDRNWQRLILAHLAEKEHIGVLTGSPVTDMKITLLAGKAHLKHTEGGDFRQATYRAVRQGLRKAENILLEPWYDFTLEVPASSVGRAMSDVQKMGGQFEVKETSGNISIITGQAPVSEMRSYNIEVNSYTKGFGHLTCIFAGFRNCHNSEEVIECIGYDVDKDIENTGDSVFCSHGSGDIIPWNKSDEYMHLENRWKKDDKSFEGNKVFSTYDVGVKKNHVPDSREEEKELQKIFEMTYGKQKKRRYIPAKTIEADPEKQRTKPLEVLPEYLLVDGYNIIFAWEELKTLARINLDAARKALLEILANYQGYRNCKVVVVFDAYKVKGGERHYDEYGNLDVVFTKEGETADTYIERISYEAKNKYVLKVATSDKLEQMIIWGNGAFKLSAVELKEEIKKVEREIDSILKDYARKNRMKHKNSIKLPEK